MENKGTVYGYCRVSTRHQKIERQIENIEQYNPNAIILEEKFTGTKVEGRKVFNNLLKQVKTGDTIIFDSVSRMSRNADEGIQIYMDLFDKGVNLVFLKEQHINTDTYRNALGNGIQLTGTDVDDILVGVNKYMKKLATQQIRIAFEQSEKEVKDLQQRTKEGIEQARKKAIMEGREFQIGLKKGTKLKESEKSIKAKKEIQKHSKDFNGTLKDVEVMKLVGLARNTYYKYKKQIIEELMEGN